MPSQGGLIFGIDYSALELRTLAAVCEHLFGYSVLGDTLRAGDDPHWATASSFEGITIEECMALPNGKSLRQRAKALNFGVPGGLGVRSLVNLAKASYGIDLSIEEAEQFRNRLIYETYPEIGEFLKDDPFITLANALQVPVSIVHANFDSVPVIMGMYRAIAGKTRATGEEYDHRFVERCWDDLESLNQNAKLDEMIAARVPDIKLSQQLRYQPVATMTGRIRSGVSYSQVRNTQFQGIAADGAKLALWELCCGAGSVLRGGIDCDRAATVDYLDESLILGHNYSEPLSSSFFGSNPTYLPMGWGGYFLKRPSVAACYPPPYLGLTSNRPDAIRLVHRAIA